MTPVALIAAVAGGLAAIAMLELLAHWRARPRAAAPSWRTGTLIMGLLTRLGRRLTLRAPGDLGARLEAAGLEVSVADVMALKAGSAAMALLAAVAGGSGLPGRLHWLAVLTAPGLGFLAPDLWVRRRRRRRRRIMEQQLGDVLELLRVAVEAGLGVRRALAEVGRRHPGLLAGELRRTAVLLELGVTHADAVTGLARRCPAEGLTALVAALRRAERHGAPLGDTLAAQAEEARARLARAATEAAARAAPKIQLVVALLLVPSAMLLVAAAMIPALSWN